MVFDGKGLPSEIRALADKNFAPLKSDPHHPMPWPQSEVLPDDFSLPPKKRRYEKHRS